MSDLVYIDAAGDKQALKFDLDTYRAAADANLSVPQYLASLPYGKLPDRSDFKRFIGDTTARQRYWHKAMAESQRLGDEFLEWVETGKLHERLQPLH